MLVTALKGSLFTVYSASFYIFINFFILGKRLLFKKYQLLKMRRHNGDHSRKMTIRHLERVKISELLGHR